jgi:DNA primase
MNYESEKLKILEDILGNYNRIGTEYLFKCPFCKHHKNKLSVNIEKNAGKCWICDWATPNLARIVKRLGNYQQQRLWSEFHGIIEISDYEKIFQTEEEKEIVVEETIKLPAEYESLCNKDLRIQSLAARRYLKERGLTKDDILYWKVGYCPDGEYKGRVIFPSFNEKGKVNYFVARNYVDDFRKYMNPDASKDIVFNELYIDWSSDVIMVEGIFDAVKAENAIPILGSTLREDSKLFAKIIEKDPALYIALDPDAEKKAAKIINSLLSYDIELYKIPIPSNKDVGDMTKEEFQEYKSQARLIKNSDYVLLNKIMSL